MPIASQIPHSATPDKLQGAQAPLTKQENSYDAVPYSGNAFPQTSPNRLAVIGKLFGLQTASPDRCRVLEMGCASGSNLIPMALNHPESQFVGVDLSPRQIADGQAIVRELGLRNIELKAQSILDIPEDPDSFDYIVAHGVYSWVPPQVQDKMLAVCRGNLAPHGIAYISYNCYPGWHARIAIREMLCYHTAHLPDPALRIKQARTLLGFLAKSIPGQETAYSAMIRQELALLQRTPATYLLHEHLDEHNEPLYFHQFAQRAMARGLQYMAEAQIIAMLASRFGPEVEKTLRAISPDLLHMEQYMDFLRNRMFRQTLLCHAEVKLERALQPDAVQRFYVGSKVKPQSLAPDVVSTKPEAFSDTGQKITTSDPLMKAALVHLSDAWPLPVQFATLFTAARNRLQRSRTPTPEESRQLATRLLNCYASLLVEFTETAPTYVTTVSSHPVASAYARLCAKQDQMVTNMRLESITLTEPSRLVLSHLDGRHDRAALIALIADWIAAHPQSVRASPVKTGNRNAVIPISSDPPKYIDHLLAIFAKNALLTG